MDAPDNNRKPIARIKNQAQAFGEIGRVPPQAIDIEQVVLGAMMLESKAINDTIDILSEKTFYDPRHQYIFKAIRGLFAATNAIDQKGNTFGVRYNLSKRTVVYAFSGTDKDNGKTTATAAGYKDTKTAVGVSHSF